DLVAREHGHDGVHRRAARFVEDKRLSCGSPYWALNVQCPSMGRPALVAFVTSLITTAAVFMGLTAAERRGHLDFLKGGGPGTVEVPSINGISVEQARDL